MQAKRKCDYSQKTQKDLVVNNVMMSSRNTVKTVMDKTVNVAQTRSNFASRGRGLNRARKD